jgi:hypothetical protein
MVAEKGTLLNHAEGVREQGIGVREEKATKRA